MAGVKQLTGVEHLAGEMTKHARLDRGLVLDDEIAAQADAHPMKARSKASGNLGEGPRQPAISGKHQDSQQSRESEGLSRRGRTTERM